MQDPPSSAVITMVLEPNHQIWYAEAFSQLHVSHKTQKIFHEFFNSGMTPFTAMSPHESKRMACFHHNNNITIMAVSHSFLGMCYSQKLLHCCGRVLTMLQLQANSSIDPTTGTVYHMYNAWRVQTLALHRIR